MCILYVVMLSAKRTDAKRISAFTNLALERNGDIPLPISRRLFEHVTQDFNISRTYLTALNTGLATYTSTIQDKGREDGREWENARQVKFTSLEVEKRILNRIFRVCHSAKQGILCLLDSDDI